MKIMMRKRSINRLISKIVFSGLLVGTLPMSLPVKAQITESVKLNNLKMEVDREIRTIKKVTTNLKRAKIIIPSVIVAVGAAVIAFAVVVAVVALKVSPRQKLMRKLKKLEKESRKLSPLDSLFYEKPRDIGVKKQEIYKKILEKKFLKTIDSAVPTISIITAIVTAIVAPLITFTAFKALSKSSVMKALQSIMRIDQIEKEYPDILTEQQKRTIAQFKNLYKDPTARGIIQGLRLKDALNSAATKAMRQNPALVITLGAQKTRRIFAKYIKLRWQKDLFEKALAEGDIRIKNFFVKMQLRRVNRKLAMVERRRGQLKEVLVGAVKQYASVANEILQELKEQIMQTREKELKPEVELKTVVPL